MWVLTRALDHYGQEGEYFVAVYKYRPTYGQLMTVFEEIDGEHSFSRRNNREFLEHLLRGGGRRNNEYEWFILKKYEEGQVLYDPWDIESKTNANHISND